MALITGMGRTGATPINLDKGINQTAAAKALTTKLTNNLRETTKNYMESKTPTYSGGSSVSYGDIYAAQRQAEIDALQKRLNAQKGIYESELGDLDNQYQALINQSELNRYKARGSIREALANRGQLDSGYGRQEALNASLNYGNQVNNIKLQRQKTRDDIKNAIASLEADYQSDLASIYSKYPQY